MVKVTADPQADPSPHCLGPKVLGRAWGEAGEAGGEVTGCSLGLGISFVTVAIGKSPLEGDLDRVS